MIPVGRWCPRSKLARRRPCSRSSPMYAYLPAKDVARARKFYEQNLGFKPKRRQRAASLYEFADHTACFLYPTPNAGTSRASQAFWQVDDVEREVAELKARGVKLEEYDMPGMKTEDGIATGDGARAAWFKDTEGNILAVGPERLRCPPRALARPRVISLAPVTPKRNLRRREYSCVKDRGGMAGPLFSVAEPVNRSPALPGAANYAHRDLKSRGRPRRRAAGRCTRRRVRPGLGSVRRVQRIERRARSGAGTSPPERRRRARRTSAPSTRRGKRAGSRPAARGPRSLPLVSGRDPRVELTLRLAGRGRAKGFWASALARPRNPRPSSGVRAAVPPRDRAAPRRRAAGNPPRKRSPGGRQDEFGGVRQVAVRAEEDLRARRDASASQAARARSRAPATRHRPDQPGGDRVRE